MKDEILAAYERIAPLVRQTPLSIPPNWEPFSSWSTCSTPAPSSSAAPPIRLRCSRAEQAAAGVVAASNGNHGLGVAAASQARGIAAEVFVTSAVSAAKARRIEAMGARIHCAGDDPLTAELAARRAADASGRVFISPYNDLDVVAGQGTIGVELHRQLPQLDAVFVAVGGGGLIGGIGAYLKAVSPQTEIVGCWPGNSPVMHQCLQAGGIVEVEELPTLSGEYSRRIGAGLGDLRPLPARDRPQRAGRAKTRSCTRCG
mgnify:CR=1 FL=1